MPQAVDEKSESEEEFRYVCLSPNLPPETASSLLISELALPGTKPRGLLTQPHLSLHEKAAPRQGRSHLAAGTALQS